LVQHRFGDSDEFGRHSMIDWLFVEKEKEMKNYAGSSENHSPHQLRKRSHFSTEYRKAPPP